MTTPLSLDDLNNSPRSRPSSIRRVRRTKDENNSAPNSRPTSRPSSRPTSRPASRPVSPTPQQQQQDDDQVIPTAIVIKNIPFSVKKDALLAKLASLDVPPAYAFNYHFDNGVFRGLAFANYRTPEETEIVVNTINGLDIGGRKLRVEYKKMLIPHSHSSSNLAAMENRKEREITPSNSTSLPSSPLMSERRLQANEDDGQLDLNDPSVLELYSYLLLFRGDPMTTEICLPKSLSAKERRDAHLIADRLGLAHYSEGSGNDRQVVIEKRGSIPAPIVRLQNKSSRGSLRSSPSRDRLNSGGGSNNRKSMMSTSTTAEIVNNNSGIIHPIRQPRGPEPGKNFASRKTTADELSDALSRLTHVGA